MLFQASAVTISGTIHGRSMMPVMTVRNGSLLLRMSAMVIPVTILMPSDHSVNVIVFFIDRM